LADPNFWIHLHEIRGDEMCKVVPGCQKKEETGVGGGIMQIKDHVCVRVWRRFWALDIQQKSERDPVGLE